MAGLSVGLAVLHVVAPLLTAALAATPARTPAGGSKAATRSVSKPASKPAPGPLGQLSRAVDAFTDADYPTAARLLDGLPARLPRVRDYVLYYAAEAEFYAGRPKLALARWRELERERVSRFAPLAPARIADCLWQSGDRAAAVTAYRKLLGPSAEGERPSPKLDRVRLNAFVAGGGLPFDPVVGRYRVALALAESTLRDGKPDDRARARAARAFRSLHVEFPAHPLAEEAARRAELLEPAVPGGPAAAPGSVQVSVQDRLLRGETLLKQLRFDDAVAELERVPATGLPTEQAAERSFLLGMTKFRMRRDYAGAAQLLLDAEKHLSGEKQATAAFHGTRALSRVHRDDDAIAGYKRFVEQYGQNKLAAEASFLAGWLDFNRGRFREALPGLEETVRRFPRTNFAADAAWFLALSRLLLNDGEAALGALERFARFAAPAGEGPEIARRIAYFRARAQLMMGRKDDAKAGFAELARRAPFSYYGLVARARLRALGAPLPLELPAWSGRLPEPAASNDPLIARVDELQTAGLSGDAGIELQRGESGLMARRGRDRGLALLLDRYPRLGAFRRAYQLAEAHGEPALASAPEGAARTFWTASYPRAFRELVDKFGPPEHNPDLFMFTIMRKESGFLPTEVSWADARGLMQLLPELGVSLSRPGEPPAFPEELYLPATNLRLGARYTGGLAAKFRGNLALAAGGYNAGGRAVVRWCDQNGSRPLDDFIELVPFDQTREYMKRVLGIYSRYHFLYDGAAFEPSLEVAGCKYDPGGLQN
jgi:soluble lytic murein transglycosylase